MGNPGLERALVEEPLRGGQMWSRVLRRGHTLELTDLEGGACVAALFYNADDLGERYNMPDTLKAQHLARLTTGAVLFSDMGRVLCSVIADSCGWHDTITGHGTARHSLAKYGAGSYQALRNDYYRNTRDNLLVELGKYELGKRDLVANLNCFVKIAVDDAGGLSYVAGHSKPGSQLILRAEMNILVVLSNTPHPLDPSPLYAPKPVSLTVRAGAPTAATDPFRHGRPEIERGFALTDRYFE